MGWCLCLLGANKLWCSHTLPALPLQACWVFFAWWSVEHSFDPGALEGSRAARYVRYSQLAVFRPLVTLVRLAPRIVLFCDLPWI